jgi:molecular chaperone IbpA
MSSIDLTPLYRSSVGFDRLAPLINRALRDDSSSNGYPPYNIEMFDDNQYAITLAVAGFAENELDIVVDKGVLKVRGQKSDEQERKFLHQGIANRTFERKFSLADHVEVTGADLSNGLLTISLVKEVPEAMKPRSIAINGAANTLEHRDTEQDQAA